MNLSKYHYIWNSGKDFAAAKCENCQAKPAVSLEADCHGDAITYCKDCWREYFEEILGQFDVDEGMVEVRPGVYRHDK